MAGAEQALEQGAGPVGQRVAEGFRLRELVFSDHGAVGQLALVVDRQEGRRFSGTFSSSRTNERIVAVISRNGTLLVADDDGYTIGSVLAPNRIELCYLKTGQKARIASCTELTKQP